MSPAGGRKKPTQVSLFEKYGHVPSAAYERTRVTFWEVIRATELHRYEVIMIENVVEAAQWELFEVWLAGMTALGYQVQFVSVSAAHVGDDEDNEPASQWRDRLYMVFTQVGMRKPDLEPRPLAWCQKCDANVGALQWWKRPGRRIGKYRKQYIYVCPVGDHGQVEPYVMPAAAAIDWTNLGTRIGDRSKPLKASTMERIQLGLETIAAPSLFFATNHGKDGGHRSFDPETRPLSSRTTKNGEGIVTTEPFLTMLRRNGRNT